MPKFAVEMTCTVTDLLRAWVTIEADDEAAAAEAALAMRPASLDWSSVHDGERENLQVDSITAETAPTDGPSDDDTQHAVCACGFSEEVCGHKQEVGACRE